MLVTIAVSSMEPRLVERFDLPALRASDTDTGELSIPDGVPLHTEVLWPTIVTGLPPDEHGLTRGRARKWDSPALQAATDLGVGLFPERLLVPVGKRLQKLGFGRHSGRDESYYRERGLETLFTGRRSVTVDVPGYSTTGEKNEIQRLMNHDAHDPDDLGRFRTAARAEFRSKRRRLLDRLDRDVDILMCYFYSLDPVQHVFFDDRERVREWYQRYDALAGEVREHMRAEDELLVVSDHGMEAGPDGKGVHSDRAFFSATWPLAMSSVLDVKPALDDFFAMRTSDRASTVDNSTVPQ